MPKLIASTPFLNIVVSVTPNGGVQGGYSIVTAPAKPVITQPDTVVNYQIVDTHGHKIFFTGMSVLPADNKQLSAASVSISGKQLTFTNANTVHMTLNITLLFSDENGNQFSHDPQMENEPLPG